MAILKAERQEDYIQTYPDAAVYGLKDNDAYNIMTFRNKALVTAIVYFGSVSPENAYTITIDGNGVTTVVKQLGVFHECISD